MIRFIMSVTLIIAVATPAVADLDIGDIAEDVAQSMIRARRDAVRESQRTARDRERARIRVLQEQERARIRAQREYEETALEMEERRLQVEMKVYEQFAERQIEEGNVPPTFQEWKENRQGVRSDPQPTSTREREVARPAPRTVSRVVRHDVRDSAPEEPTTHKATKSVSDHTPPQEEIFTHDGKTYRRRGNEVFVLISQNGRSQSWKKVGEVEE